MSNITKTANTLIGKAIAFFDVVKNSKVDFISDNKQAVYVDPLGSKIQPLPTEFGHNRYDIHGADNTFRQEVHFQNGSPSQNGVNGISNEALISVVLHRLYRQNESFPSPYNMLAITLLQGAMSALHSRVKDRQAFGIYDTDKIDPEKTDDATLAKALAIVNSLGILGDIIIKFDSAYGLAASNTITSFVELLASNVNKEEVDIDISSAFSLTATAVMGSGIFRGFATVGSQMLKVIDEAKRDQNNSANNAE